MLPSLQGTDNLLSMQDDGSVRIQTVFTCGSLRISFSLRAVYLNLYFFDADWACKPEPEVIDTSSIEGIFFKPVT